MTRSAKPPIIGSEYDLINNLNSPTSVRDLIRDNILKGLNSGFLSPSPDPQIMPILGLCFVLLRT